MITRLHSHPGPLCRFLFSCSMPSSPPSPSLPPSAPPLPPLLLPHPLRSLSSTNPVPFVPISSWKSYPIEPSHLSARKTSRRPIVDPCHRLRTLIASNTPLILRRTSNIRCQWHRERPKKSSSDQSENLMDAARAEANRKFI